MARFGFCSKSGWFLRTSKEGLCEACAHALSLETESNLRVLKESLNIASTTKKLDTMLSRFGVAENACRQLLKYERRGIPSIAPSPSKVIEVIESERHSAILGWIDRELMAARAKSEAATTPAGKTRGYSKLLESINTLYAQVDHTDEIQTSELAVRNELDAVRLKVEIDRAGKLEFRGQKKRACEAYLDALYLLRGDSIPDDEQQVEIARIEAKIAALGGEVPGRTMGSKTPVTTSTLPSDLTKKVDALIQQFSEIPKMTESTRKRLADRFQRVSVGRILDEGLTYGKASGAPEFLNQDEESFSHFMKEVDQDLDWQCDTVAAAFDRYGKTGEIPAPHYPMRVAVLLRKAKELEREKQFLAGWCKHFPSGNGAKYHVLVERAKKAGASQSSD